MQQASQQVMYFIGENFLILKLMGTLRFDCAPFLEKALKNLKDAGSDNEIIIDMKSTKYLDSTIMGIIVKYFLQVQGDESFSSPPMIVFENDDLKRNFETIGFDKFFNFQKTDKRINIPLESFIKFEDIHHDKEKLRGTVYRAHQALNELQPQNDEFKLVIQSLKDK